MIPKIRTLVPVCLLFTLLFGCGGEEESPGTKEGGDFVALRASETNLRAGPGKHFPVVYVYKLRHMPLRVLGEYDKWLRVIDMDGDSGWVNEGLTTKLRTVITINTEQFMYHNFDQISYPTHRVEKSVVARLLGCKKHRCRVSIGKTRGWINKSDLWGYGW
ncbi:MAG: SH3 domain-containing protein [Rickettsiales bacterium]|jgi:SH3-like domain-containing protein|nr:SH3 domain-containing protein [Rickettsiales bacterium]